MSAFKNNPNFNLYYSDTDSIVIDRSLSNVQGFEEAVGPEIVAQAQTNEIGALALAPPSPPSKPLKSGWRSLGGARAREERRSPRPRSESQSQNILLKELFSSLGLAEPFRSLGGAGATKVYGLITNDNQEITAPPKN
jgi:hypothetical protein